MIFSFANDETRAFHGGFEAVALAGLERAAGRKLDELDAATDVRDLNRPANDLRATRRHRQRARRWAIRVDDAWRVGFQWPAGSGGPVNVEIVAHPPAGAGNRTARRAGAPP